MVQNIEHSTLCHTGQIAARYTKAANATKWRRWGMLINGETNFVLQCCTYWIATGAEMFALHVRM